MQITLDIPEKYLVNYSPSELVAMLKLNTAIDQYRRGRFSATVAADFVGTLDRYEFLYECRKRGVEPQTYESTDELQAEVDDLMTKIP